MISLVANIRTTKKRCMEIDSLNCILKIEESLLNVE